MRCTVDENGILRFEEESTDFTAYPDSSRALPLAESCSVSNSPMLWEVTPPVKCSVRVVKFSGIASSGSSWITTPAISKRSKTSISGSHTHWGIPVS